MMMNLFSTFDPCTGLLSLNWLSSITIMIIMKYELWVTNNNINHLIKKVTLKIQEELILTTNQKGLSLILTSIFIMILLNNIMGLMPYIFTSSSHLVFSLSLALPFWMTLMIFGWVKKTKFMLAHLVPLGTPTMLMPFMIIIETISNLIRPGSLSVRLSANMIAGHLIMCLLGSNTSLLSMSLLMLMFIFLMLFETAVSIIQSYVFMTLLSLYSSEI